MVVVHGFHKATHITGEHHLVDQHGYLDDWMVVPVDSFPVGSWLKLVDGLARIFSYQNCIGRCGTTTWGI